VAVGKAAREVVMSGLGASTAVFLFLSVGAVALFGFIAVASWSDARRKEREAYYKSETLKKLSESQGSSAVLDLLREENKQAATRRKEGLRLGGLVNLAVGVGLMIFLRGLVPDEGLYLVGIIPLLIGVALLFYSLFLAPRE
jgi:hypothetical protein